MRKGCKTWQRYNFLSNPPKNIVFFYVYAYKIPIFRDTFYFICNPSKQVCLHGIPSHHALPKCIYFRPTILNKQGCLTTLTLSGSLVYCNLGRLSCVVFPLGVTHIAALEEFLVHSQRATQYVRCVRRLCHSDILV